MSRVRFAGFVLLALVTFSLVAPDPGMAAKPWSLAMKTDEEILVEVSGLNADAPGADIAPAVAMLREVAWDVLPGSRLLYRNTVLQVNDVEEISDIASGFYLDARGEIAMARAFRIRNGKLTRHDVKMARGDGEVRRARLMIDLGDLQPGDIVGVSSITRFDNILYFNKVPICSYFPVASFSLRVHVEENHSYMIRSDNFDGLDVQVMDEKDGRAVEWHATASGIAGVEGFYGAGPFAPGTPLALVVESEEYVQAANGWFGTLAWQRVALYLSTIRELAISSMIGAWEKTPAVIAGASTNAEKEAAIFTFVRDELQLMHGRKYDPLGHRSAAEVFESGRATPMEQVMIMVTMLNAAGLPGEIGIVRSEAWGPLDQHFQSFVQFQDVAIRCGQNNTRYYVPYVTDAPVGSLPAEWGASWVLTPAPGLTVKAAVAAGEVMSGQHGDVHSAFLRLRQQSAEKGWFHLEHVGGESR